MLTHDKFLLVEYRVEQEKWSRRFGFNIYPPLLTYEISNIPISSETNNGMQINQILHWLGWALQRD